MAAKIFRINYKSDFILTLNSDAGWMTPFCIKFWTDAPSQAFFVGWDGTTYTHCAYDPAEPTKLLVQFDDHHLPIGDLKFQIAYHFTVADFPNDTEDEVISPANITTEIDGQTYQVMLDFTGETAPEIAFSLPAYANEQRRIANEQQRIENEQIRISNEETRIQHEDTRQANETLRIERDQAHQNNEAQRIQRETARQENEAQRIQREQARQDNETLRIEREQIRQDHEAQRIENEAARVLEFRSIKETAASDHQRAESDHETAVADHTQAGNDHTRAESDHGIAVDDHTQAGNDHTRAESDHAAVDVYVDSLGVFDLSKHNAVGGVLATYTDLSAALTALNALESKYKYGGMSIKFIRSSDNKYLQYRYMGTSTATANFTNVANWQGVDAEPTAGSNNLVKSEGVFNDINSLRTDNFAVKDGNTDIPPILIGYALYSTGEPITNSYLANCGVTDFIPVGSNDTVKIISGVMQAGSTNYPYIAFYNASKEKLSVKSVATAGEITNTEETVPNGAAYFRLTTANNSPAVIDYKGKIAKAIEDLQGDVADLQNTVDTSLSGLQDDVDECRDLLGLNSAVKVKCATGLEGYVLMTDGTAITSAYTTTKGVSDYIPVTAGDSFVLSGAYCGSTNYAYLCFYSSASESGFISEKHTSLGPVDNVNVTVPNGATYMRITLNDKTVPATLDYGIEPVNVVELKEEVEDGFERLSDTKLFFDLSRQMYNPPLPIKDTDEELNILYIGSSYGVDTISALVDICKNVGLKVNTADMYKSGGTTAQYLDDLANNRTNTTYYNYYNKDSVTYLRKVDAVVKVKPWDVIIVQDSSVRLATKTAGYDTNFVKWISALREMCTNPRVVFAFNATWVHADNMANQRIAYEEAYKLMQQSGIDIAVPSGAAIEYLRATDVNDGNNIYRDALHLDVGVGRFTAACSLFFAIVNYVYGVGLDNCTLTGKWDVQGSPVSTNPTIEVTDANRDTCIACAKRAITNRFMLPTE